MHTHYVKPAPAIRNVFEAIHSTVANPFVAKVLVPVEVVPARYAVTVAGEDALKIDILALCEVL